MSWINQDTYGTIYKIINDINDLIYIGSTINFEKRKWRHLNDLRNNKHHIKLFQNHFNTHGEYKMNLKFIIIEECENCRNAEENYIRNYGYNKLYNISKNSFCGDNISYHPNKKEIIKRGIKTRLERIKYGVIVPEKYFGDKNPNWKGGKSINNFCDSCDAKISRNAKRCVKCSKKSLNNPFFGKNHSEETKSKLREANKGKKPINTIKVKIEGVEYNSCTEASKVIGCSTATILNRVKSKNKKFINYVFI